MGVFNGQYFGLDEFPSTLTHACGKKYYCPKGTTIKMERPPATAIPFEAAGKLQDALPVPAGFYGADVTPCPTGYYCPIGSETQTPCPPGTYRDSTHGTDVSDCGYCPAGTYCDLEGTTTPTTCGAGHFCPEGSIEMSACPPGTYNDDTGGGLYDSRDCT